MGLDSRSANIPDQHLPDIIQKIIALGKLLPVLVLHFLLVFVPRDPHRN